jgi:hypothetical protein
MPLLVPGIIEPKNKTQPPEDTKAEKEEEKKDESAETKSSKDTTDAHKIDGRKAPGMEGMSDEAVRRFEEAMELEYQKREGGA